MMYLYAISHRNLPVHQQAIQGAHAQLEWVRQNGIPADHPTFVWLTVANKMDLLILQTVLECKGVKVTEFHDPDFEGYDPSAIACMLTEEQRSILSDLHLWRCGPAPKERPRLGRYNQAGALEDANRSERATLATKLKAITAKMEASARRVQSLMGRPNA